MMPAEYVRRQREWKQWIGKTGIVVATTVIRVSPPGQQVFAPYSYVIVDFGKEKHEWMGAGHETFVIGSKVCCVLKKTGVGAKNELVEYGIKVTAV